MPKFLGWFGVVLERNPTGTAHLVGARLSYADLSLFQLVEGLRYAFPKAMDALGRDISGVLELAGRIGQRRNIAAYLASPRRQRSEENTSEPQSIMRKSYAVSSLQKKKKQNAEK